MKHLIYTPLFLFMVSCASHNKIEITANPDGAEVFVSDKFLGDYRSVGKTPMTLDLTKEKTKGRFVHISVRAEDHDAYNLVLPKKFASGSVKLKLDKAVASRGLASLGGSTEQELKDKHEDELKTLKYNHLREVQSLNDQIKISKMLAMNQNKLFDQEKRRMKDELESESRESVQKIFNKTFEIQNALQNKKLSKAGKALAELKSLNPPETLFLTLEGNFEFLNGRVNKALASYKRALKIDPSNLELVSIVKKLERVLRG